MSRFKMHHHARPRYRRSEVTVFADACHNALGMLVRGLTDERAVKAALKKMAARWFPGRRFAYESGPGSLTVAVDDSAVEFAEVRVPALLKKDRVRLTATLRSGEMPFPFWAFLDALPFDVVEIPLSGNEAQDVCAVFKELVI